MSPKCAGLAKKMGYTNVRVYIEGEPGWKQAGHYTVSSAGFVKDGNIILVDLRSVEKAASGSIPRAANIPADMLEQYENSFPSYLSAPIVFYSDSMDDMIHAVKVVREWGYKKATLFPGGTSDWKSQGYSLTTGPVSQEITFVRKLGPGEISIADFQNALKTGEVIILDTRTPEEYEAGHIQGAINIPSDDMTTRYAELPKDKKVITYCITGVRAEMAFTVLKEKGYDAQCLKANIAFYDDGSYEISE